MKTAILLSLLMVLAIGCRSVDEPNPDNTNKVLMLKIDYTTNTFEGGKELLFSKDTNVFSIKTEYTPPGDFGSIKIIYSELNETIFNGTIIWMGTGKITYPENIIPADSFSIVMTDDFVTPSAGFENIFNPGNQIFDYTPVWISVQGLVKVRQYLRSNPNATVKIFLYTPSVGVGNPLDWDWIIFLKN